MIPVYCHTNLDLYNERWPESLPALPSIGQEIESATEWPGGFRLSLKVISVRWIYNYHKDMWLPRIELHMTSFQAQLPCSKGEWSRGSIMAFYEWYAPKVGRTISSFI